MENTIKINNDYLNQINETSCLKYFGDWVYNIDELKESFKNGKPFENIVIDNFLNEEYAEILHNKFGENFENWYKYINPIEVKYAYDNIEILPTELKNYFYYLSSREITSIVSQISGIPNLEYDEYLHGAGLHAHPKYGRLSLHLDYEMHPCTRKERRLNIIYFLNKEWGAGWNGANELWNNDVSECTKKTDIKFNRAIIFKTNDISFHGVPDIIRCPEHVYRKSLAYYYVSPLNMMKAESEYRQKAKYIKKASEPYCEKNAKLYKIRENRRLTENDVIEIMPEWNITK